jgi:uncharacterized repeat protein (TIGR01451 family)
MKNLWRRKACVLAVFLTGAFFLWGGMAQAQQQPRLELKTTVEKEVKVKKKGKWVTERMAVEQTGPGNVLVYTITYLNAGKTAAVDARIVNPIPKGAVYLPDSAEGKDADITCSIDNGHTWHKQPVMMQMKKPDGALENRPAPAESYTQISWVIKKPVLPGRTGRVSFKATVK